MSEDIALRLKWNADGLDAAAKNAALGGGELVVRVTAPYHLVGNLREAADEILRLRSELEQCQQAAFRAMEWQPIETAPKDGTVIDLWCEHGRLANCHWSDDNDGWQQAWAEMPDGSFDVECSPTHWLPLPPPPKENGK